MTEPWKGIAAAPGYAAGKAYLLKSEAAGAAERQLSAEEVPKELERFRATLRDAIQEIGLLQQSAKEHIGEEQAEIFDFHMTLLDRSDFVQAIETMIRVSQVNAEEALRQATADYTKLFESMESPYMRERAADIRDVGRRLARLLGGFVQQSLNVIKEPVIVVADDLTPSETAQLHGGIAAGFITNIGGRTSHSAIMARSMELPAVTGLQTITDRVQEGDYLLVDGYEGLVYINPDQDTVSRFQAKCQKLAERKREWASLVDEPSATADGRRVELAANIGNPEDAVHAASVGSEGIGLYRTEFLYMGRTDFPSEEEQFQAYKAAVQAVGSGQPVVIRTLDIGGDKKLPYWNLPEEANPFLGFRAVRLCLAERDIFKVQLRAILRASACGNVKIMFPMIAAISELRQAKQALKEAMDELDQAGLDYNKSIEIGIMIEIPAAAIIADSLAKEVDFFSIGSNDLIQYVMAADRMNEQVSYLYEPFHPAVLRLIHTTIEAAHREGKWVGMCGEMAGDPEAIPLLLGLGLDEFSMSAGSILPARGLLRKIRYKEQQRIAREALTLESAEAVRRLLRT